MKMDPVMLLKKVLFCVKWIVSEVKLIVLTMMAQMMIRVELVTSQKINITVWNI